MAKQPSESQAVDLRGIDGRIFFIFSIANVEAVDGIKEGQLVFVARDKDTLRRHK